MNTEEKITPLPWEACCLDAKPHYLFGPNGDETICSFHHNDPSEDGYERHAGTVTMEERRANAAYIVRACNAYPALVEALEDIAKQKLGCEMEDRENADWEMGYEIIVEIARAALAAAKEGGQGE